MTGTSISEIIKATVNETCLALSVNKHKVIYSNADLIEMLDVSARTLKRWRDEGEIGYSRKGDKFFYSEDDINQFLKNNHEEAFAYKSARCN